MYFVSSANYLVSEIVEIVHNKGFIFYTDSHRFLSQITAEKIKVFSVLICVNLW